MDVIHLEDLNADISLSRFTDTGSVSSTMSTSNGRYNLRPNQPGNVGHRLRYPLESNDFLTDTSNLGGASDAMLERNEVREPIEPIFYHDYSNSRVGPYDRPPRYPLSTSDYRTRFPEVIDFVPPRDHNFYIDLTWSPTKQSSEKKVIFDFTSPEREKDKSEKIVIDLTGAERDEERSDKVFIDLTRPEREQDRTERIFIDLTCPSPEPTPIISGEVRQATRVTEESRMPLPVYQLPPAYKSISVTYHAAPPNRATFPVVCNGDTTTNVIPVLSNPDRAPSPEGRSVDYTICRRIPLQRDPEKPNLDQGVSAKLPRMAHQLPENPEFDFSASFNLAEELELLQEEEELERLQEESKGSNVVNDLIGDDSESDLSKSNLLPTAPTTPTSTCPTSISTSIASTTLTSTTSISLPSPAFPNFPTLPVPSNLQIDEPTPEVLFKVRARSSALDFAKDMVDVPNIWGFLHCHIVWTDGSLPRNGMGGSAIVWKVGLGERWRSLRRKLTFQTDRSEFAELHGLGMAVEKAINLVKEARDTRQAPLIDQVVILTDCTSCMYMVRDHYLDRYGPPQIFNSTLRLITGALRLLKRMGVVVEFHWVPGHSGVLGNDLADSEARSAARMEMKSHQAGNEAPHPDVERFVPV